MKANELRIGNLLRDKVSKTELKVIELTEKDIVTYVIDRSKFPLKSGWGLEPIPLTSEILLKCGFQIRDKKYSLNYGGESMRFAILENDIRNPFILYFHGRFGFNLNEGRKNGDYCIQNVHQLQNLYWCLCGKELTFNNL